jgi:putative flippase GtrA
MLPELLKFGIVGGIGSIIDLGGTDVLHSDYHVGPLAAKAVAVIAATAATYLGSRFWTFKHRENQAAHREAVLFVVLNVVGLLIAEAVIGFVTYVLGLHSKLEFNGASVIGTGLGTVFRFYAYRKWVFTAPAGQPAMASAGRSPVPDYAPWDLDPNYLAPAQPVPAAMAPMAQRPAAGSRWSQQPAWGQSVQPPQPQWDQRDQRDQRTGWGQPAPAYAAASSWDQVPAASAGWGEPRAEEPAGQGGRVTSPTLTALPATHDPRRPDTRPDSSHPRPDSTGPRTAGRHRRV